MYIKKTLDEIQNEYVKKLFKKLQNGRKEWFQINKTDKIKLRLNKIKLKKSTINNNQWQWLQSYTSLKPKMFIQCCQYE